MKHRPGKARTLPPLPSELVPPEVRLVNQSVMRSEWVDPTDSTPSAARTARTVNAWRSYDPLRKCLGHQGSKITLAHVVAADLLRRLTDGVAIGFSGGRDLMSARSWQFGPITGFGAPAVKSAKAWPAFRRAMARYNKGERDLLTFIVLLNMSVRAWCARQRELGSYTNPDIEMRRLVACLDRLVEHFRSEIERDLGRDAVV
jgi:hypothetical protein